MERKKKPTSETKQRAKQKKQQITPNTQHNRTHTNVVQASVRYFTHMHAAAHNETQQIDGQCGQLSLGLRWICCELQIYKFYQCKMWFFCFESPAIYFDITFLCYWFCTAIERKSNQFHLVRVCITYSIDCSRLYKLYKNMGHRLKYGFETLYFSWYSSQRWCCFFLRFHRILSQNILADSVVHQRGCL